MTKSDISDSVSGKNKIKSNDNNEDEYEDDDDQYLLHNV